MERLTTKTEDTVYYVKGKYKPKTLSADMEPWEVRECIQRLAAYEDTGLTPDEISRLHTVIEQQGKELNRRDELIRKIDEERDYWELEAKKWAGKLAELRYQIQQEICKRCSLENTSKCKEC